MTWDPMGAWPRERPWIWLTLAGWLLFLRGPAFVENLKLRPPTEIIPDFFGDYASARSWTEGLPVYAEHRETVPRYVGVRLNERRSHVFFNAHPPTSVLLALPFAAMSFPTAFLAWNLTSLAALAASVCVVQRQLRIPVRVWSFAPVVALLSLCFPLWEQCRLGQLTLILLLLVTGTWAAERSGRPWLAGALLGAATTIKLFPGCLFLHYALCRRWKVVAAGMATMAGLTALTAALLGLDAYRAYLLRVLPGIQHFRAGWNNDSLWGFWSRLFDPALDHPRDWSLSQPVSYSPALALLISVISSSAIVAILARAVHRNTAGQGNDLTFALAVTATLLVSPICWDHYLLILLVPLAAAWVELPASRLARALFVVIVAAFWVGHPTVWELFGLLGRAATPLESLCVLSYQFYALLGLFALICLELRGGRTRSAAP
jgi:Glycosyltransferase family 87